MGNTFPYMKCKMKGDGMAALKIELGGLVTK